ncbi:hypothetical protein [Oceanicaulis sp.]|uniref:vWA domain-containing protein n=1 Tax=Oceanicaulis sp. TaxID=1924941 RepID=UPI003D2D8CF2
MKVAHTNSFLLSAALATLLSATATFEAQASVSSVRLAQEPADDTAGPTEGTEAELLMEDEARADTVEPEPEAVTAVEAEEPILMERAPGAEDDANIADGVTCSDAGPCIVDATGQPFRVLPRSFSAVYAEPDETSDLISNEVRPFNPSFVFSRVNMDFSDPARPQGWYQIGFSESAPFGWMRAQDVVEWRQALLLAYTHPGSGLNRRTPVLMFEEAEPLRALVTSPDRAEMANALLDTMTDGEKPEEVIARESDSYLDIDEDFYILPVIQWEREQAFAEPSHYIQVFAAVPGARATDGEDTLLSEDVRARGGDTSPAAPEGPLTIDVKFVIDMTGSMGPYIDAAVAGLADVVQELDAEASEDLRFRFGLVGFRDNPESTPELGWAAQDFTADGLLPADEMLELLSPGGGAFIANTTSDEWAEDVFAGVDMGIEGPWSTAADENAARFMVLVGDASAHEPGSQRGSKSTTGQSADELRQRLNGANTYLQAYHILDPVAAVDFPIAEAQMRRLADNPGAENAYIAVDADDTATISTGFDFFTRELIEVVQSDVDALQARVESNVEPEALSPEAGRSAAQAVAAGDAVIRAALVDYLGDSADPAKDFVAWVHDYDLADPTVPALDVRVLVSRDQLDTILGRTEAIHEAMVNAIGARVDFFQQLRSVAARSSLGVELNADDTLAEQEFIPRWVSALPYRSQVLGMSPGMFANMSQSQQIQFERTILSKVNALREISANTDAWIKLDENDPEIAEVTALPLALLP